MKTPADFNAHILSGGKCNRVIYCYNQLSTFVSIISFTTVRDPLKELLPDAQLGFARLVLFVLGFARLAFQILS